MTRVDWWLGVALILAALLVYAASPRFELVLVSVGGGRQAPVLFDRWYGNAQRIGVD